MVRSIDDVNVTDVEKRKIPSKHYVYLISVTWSDGSTNIIYRRYSRFFDLQSKIMDIFPEEAGTIDPQSRIIPFLPGKKFFGRSHIREVAVKRMVPIAMYCRAIVKLPVHISKSREVTEFFEMEPDDIDPPKDRKKASIKANKISMPKVLEHYICVSEYKKQEKGEVSLKVGMMAEVAEKTESGWWFVHAEEEEGWVPSTCLEREDGVKEDSTVKFRSGEEVYLCTEEFVPQGEDELAMDRGAVVDVIEKNLEGWWLVSYNGKQGYAPATYLIKSDVFSKKKPNAKPAKSQKPTPLSTSQGGPEIIRSLVEISDLLKENDQSDNEGGDCYDEPIDRIYTVQELSKILKEDKRGNSETDEVYEKIENLKSRSLTRGGSMRPPPRPVMKPKFQTKNRAPPVRLASISKEYITIASFSDSVGDGISFQAGESVKVMDKNESGWWFVEIGGREGWAPADYIELTGTTEARPPSPEAVPIQKPKSHTEDREVLKDTTGIGSLAGALKAKLATKNTPPAPPKKAFIGVHNNSENEINTNADISATPKSMEQDVSKHTTAKAGGFPGLKKTVVKDSDNIQLKPSSNIALKPIAKNKSPSRGNQPPPPLPPPKSGANDPKQDIKKPTPPHKAKFDLTKKSDSSKTSEPPFSKNDTDEPKINVAGLAGALKAKFESQGAGTGAFNKPTLSNKPSPPNLFNKQVPSSLSNKPVPPSTTNKPSLPISANKPILATGTDKGGVLKKMPDPPLKPKPGIGTKPKPSGGTSKAPWQRNTEDDSSETIADSGTRVSDLANALKSRFENRQKSDDSSPTDLQKNVRKGPVTPSSFPKPLGALKPKPARPSSPPAKVKTVQSSPSTPNQQSSGDNIANMAKHFGAKPNKELDPKKYTSRPLPAKPPEYNVKSKSEISCSTTKPGPSLPFKPLPSSGGKSKPHKKTIPMRQTSDSDSDSDSDCRPAGVAGIANALKAKLEGQFSGNTVNTGNSSSGVTKLESSTAQKPTRNEVKITTKVNEDFNSEINNNGFNGKIEHNDDDLYAAIGDYDGENDGEVSLKMGQQVQVLDKADGWWFVKYESVNGWAPSAYLEKIGSADVQKVPDSSCHAVTESISTHQTVYRTCSDFTAENEGEISFTTGQEVTVVDSTDEGWWLVQIGAAEGWVPATFVQEF